VDEEAAEVEGRVAALAAEIQTRIHTAVDAANLTHLTSDLLGAQLAGRIATWGTDNATTASPPLPPRCDVRCEELLQELRGLHNVVAFLATQRAVKAQREGVLYRLGEVLRHKKFGFRGAVAGWDARPVVDVRHWEGVAGLPSGAEQSFYHIFPDTADCIEAFGAPRESRYVAQENLERIETVDRLISSGPQLSQMFPLYSDEEGRFVPCPQLAYQYPNDYDEAAAESAEQAVGLIEILQTELRAGVGEARESIVPDLFRMLSRAERRSDAEVIEDTIWACWRFHPDPALTALLDTGTRLLDAGKPEEALGVFEDVLARDSSWVEAVNKRATALFYCGWYDRSLHDTMAVLEAEPRHFGALAGQGMCFMHQGDYAEAAGSFRKALELHPWRGTAVTNLQAALKATAADGGGNVNGAAE